MSQFTLLCLIWGAIGISTFILLQFINAPYGRHNKKGWGPQLPNKLGWILMESPSLILVAYFYLAHSQSLYASMLSLLWIGHYIYRTLVFPFRIRTKGKKMPLLIVLSAIGFNCVNASLNGYYLSNLADYSNDSFLSWNFWLGILLFITGFFIHYKSDSILINLRKPGETGYKLPKGFLFSRVSCPNMLGELIEWTGFTLMAWNVAALSFTIWTAANLLPRAKGHHQWYLDHFKDYPVNRKILFPGIW